MHYITIVLPFSMIYWHCPHSMRELTQLYNNVYVTVEHPSVHLSVLSFNSCCGVRSFAAERSADSTSIDSGGRLRPAASAPQQGAQQQMSC